MDSQWGFSSGEDWVMSPSSSDSPPSSSRPNHGPPDDRASASKRHNISGIGPFIDHIISLVVPEPGFLDPVFFPHLLVLKKTMEIIILFKGVIKKAIIPVRR